METSKVKTSRKQRKSVQKPIDRAQRFLVKRGYECKLQRESYKMSRETLAAMLYTTPEVLAKFESGQKIAEPIRIDYGYEQVKEIFRILGEMRKMAGIQNND